MKIFLITKGLNRKPKQIFLSKDYTNAKLYFEGYIFGEIDFNDYKLYEIGEIGEKFKIDLKKIYITDGFEIKNKSKFDKKNKLIKQIELDLELKKQAEKETEQWKQIEILFQGRQI